MPSFCHCKSSSFSNKYDCLTRDESLRRIIFIRYLIMCIFWITENGYLPSLPYRVDTFVHFFTPNIRLKNLVCINSMSVASCMPHISDPKFKIEATSVSKRLHFWEICNSIVLKIVKRLYKAKDECLGTGPVSFFEKKLYQGIWTIRLFQLKYCLYRNLGEYVVLFRRSWPLFFLCIDFQTPQVTIVFYII